MKLLRHIGATLALCAVFCVPSHADSPALNNLATRLTGTPTTVACFPAGGEYAGYVVATSSDGVTWNMEHTIQLAGDDCGALQNVLTPTTRTMRWLHTFDGGMTVGQAWMHLTHEATHIILESVDEGLVECTAYRNLWPDTRLLPLDWKMRQAVYRGAAYNHLAKPTTGAYADYRSVC